MHPAKRQAGGITVRWLSTDPENIEDDKAEKEPRENNRHQEERSFQAATCLVLARHRITPKKAAHAAPALEYRRYYHDHGEDN